MSRSYCNLPRPFKVWSFDRQKRKSITASNLNELKARGAEKLGYDDHNYHRLRVVFECDGTEIEDDSYFQSAEKDTVFLLLRDNENWLPPGMDALKSALSAIPQIVCDTINSLKLANKSPAWSIKDDQGYITVTLQWEHDGDKFKYLSDFEEPSWKLSSQPSYAQYGDKVYSSTFPRPSSSRAKSYETYLRGVRNLGTLAAYRSALPYKTLSADDFSFIDRADDLSSAHDLTSYCDFHCSSLHREGGSIKVSKSVGTSPILDFSRNISPTVTTSPYEKGSSAQIEANIVAQTSSLKAKKGHVRFMDMDKNNIDHAAITAATAAKQTNISLLGLINGRVDASSSESETETTERDDEQYCERYLLLVDQLTANHKKHLTIKDIGIILERLKSKIVDIDKLERDKETIGCYNWLIKAIIKGDMLREIGVVYNGQYYSLMEHPGYF